MKTKRKTPKKERAAHLGQQAAPKYYSQEKSYRKATPMSRNNLKDEIGLLLWFLCSPLNKKQGAAGYQLLEIMLLARYERRAL